MIAYMTPGHFPSICYLEQVSHRLVDPSTGDDLERPWPLSTLRDTYNSPCVIGLVYLLPAVSPPGPPAAALPASRPWQAQPGGAGDGGGGGASGSPQVQSGAQGRPKQQVLPQGGPGSSLAGFVSSGLPLLRWWDKTHGDQFTNDPSMAPVATVPPVIRYGKPSDAVTGYILFELHRKLIDIVSLVVHRDHRRQNIGSALLRRVMEKLEPTAANPDGREAWTYVNECNIEGQLFLRANGWRCEGIQDSPRAIVTGKTERRVYKFVCRLASKEKS